MDIGILDFGDISNAKSSMEIVEGVVSYAVRAEKLGFSRFWLSEHHPRSIVWSNPLMMLGILGTQTSTINIGAGGILSAFHSPYHIYDQFRQLSIIFPNRIDIGYANGVPANNIQDLLLDKKITENVSVKFLYEENTKKTVHFFNNSHGEENIHSFTSPRPNNWILTSSLSRLDLALETGADICFSSFHSFLNTTGWKEKLSTFKYNFLEKHKREAKIMLAICGFISKYNKSAFNNYQNTFGKDYNESSNVLAGDVSFLKDKLEMWREELHIDEFIFKDVETDSKKRRKTLDLISSLL